MSAHRCPSSPIIHRHEQRGADDIQWGGGVCGLGHLGTYKAYASAKRRTHTGSCVYGHNKLVCNDAADALARAGAAKSTVHKTVGADG